MKTKIASVTVALFGLFLLGCGGSDGGDGLEGGWAVSISSTCDFVAVFKGSNYVVARYCPLQGGGYGAEGEQGAFTISGNQLTTTAAQASCQSAADFTKVTTAGWSVKGDTLTITFPEGALVMKRVPGGEPMDGLVLSWGCLNDMGFMPGSLSAVP